MNSILSKINSLDLASDDISSLLEKLYQDFGPIGASLAGEWLLIKGKPLEALWYLKNAAEALPNEVVVGHNYAESLRQTGQISLASQEFQRVIDLKKDFLPARYALINVLENLIVLMRESFCEDEALSQSLGLSNLLNDTGNLLLQSGQGFLAIGMYEKALQVNPDSPAVWSNLGNIFHQEGLWDRAENCCKKAIELNPGLASAWINLAAVYSERGMIEKSEACYDRAADLDVNLIPQIKHNRYSGALFNSLHSINHSDEEIFEKHKQWGVTHCGIPAAEDCILKWKPGDLIRVGYISADFRSHAMRHYLEPLIAAHDRSAVEVYCYYQNTIIDEYTKNIIGYKPVWRNTYDLSDEEFINQVRGDNIHILVDCLGHTQGSRLLALSKKPAPIQMSYLGYLGTTGLAAIDYRLTDYWMDPEGTTENFHTEKLLRVNETCLAYSPHFKSPNVNELPAVKNGYITFGSLNKFKKLNPLVIQLWIRILKSIPNSRLLLKTKQVSDPGTKLRMLSWFESHGIDLKRIDLRASSKDHLNAYHEIDIALDTFPFGGGATTCDALWMGVPVITAPGTRSSSRMTHCILNVIGRSEWSVSNFDLYVDKAIEIASNINELKKIRFSLRQEIVNSKIMDWKGFARRIEDCYRFALMDKIKFQDN